MLMKIPMKKFAPLLVSLLLCVSAGAQQSAFQGQAPSRQVDTHSRPIDIQKKGVFPFEADGLYFSNDFDGARLNQIERTGKNRYTIFIAPENTPINMSPWYAFQVWSKAPAEISVQLVYPAQARHRYAPKLSRDGRHWTDLDAAHLIEEDKALTEPDTRARAKRVRMRLLVEPQALWVAGQEMQTSSQVFEWIDEIAHKHALDVREIGKSTQGRPLKMLTIGDKSAKKMMLVISRQHPPEVTGYFAMQAFVDTLAADTELAQRFRKDWSIHVVPLMNPDGVDGGHWRHNAGGIDLNRDWADFNQPETRAVRDFLKQREQETGGKFYFGVDFHSTWDDIYYPMNKKFTGNMPNLVWDWLDRIQTAIPNYRPNIRPTEQLEPTIISRNYFLKAHGMEAIVFEIGDDTSRALIREKGEVGATELMKLMLAKSVP
jgi:hypothetical protein